MADLSAALVSNRAAVDEMLAAIDRSAANWTTPRAAGKWSPSQVVEHVARSLEESANVIMGAPSKFPNFPRFIRPLVRMMFFDRVVKTGAFPKARTSKAMNPASGAATAPAGRARLEEAAARFDGACRTAAERGPTFDNGLFGVISIADYVRFMDLHTRHHTRQIPVTTERVMA